MTVDGNRYFVALWHCVAIETEHNAESAPRGREIDAHTVAFGADTAVERTAVETPGSNVAKTVFAIAHRHAGTGLKATGTGHGGRHLKCCGA